jgi:hypothetical protein
VAKTDLLFTFKGVTMTIQLLPDVLRYTPLNSQSSG